MKPWEKTYSEPNLKPWERQYVRADDPSDIIPVSRWPQFELEPAEQAQVSVADFLSRRHGVPFDDVFGGYGDFSKSVGLSGNAEADYATITERAKALAQRAQDPERKPAGGLISKWRSKSDEGMVRAQEYHRSLVAEGLAPDSTPAEMSRAAQFGRMFAVTMAMPLVSRLPGEDKGAGSDNSFVAIPSHVKDRFIGSASRMLADAVKIGASAWTRVTEDDFASAMIGRELAQKAHELIPGAPERRGQEPDNLSNIEDNRAYQFGQGMERGLSAMFGGNDDLMDSFAMTTIPDTMGSFASYIGLGLLTQGRTAVAQSPGFIGGIKTFLTRLSTNPSTYMAAGSQAVRAYDEAGLYGLEEAERRLAMDKAIPSGVVQVMNVTRVLGRWDKAFEGKITNKFIRMVKEGIVGGVNEGFVEGLGEGMYNVGVRRAWDEDAAFLDNTFDSAVAGGTGGAIMGFIMEGLRASAMRGKGGRRWNDLNASQKNLIGTMRVIDEIGVDRWDSLTMEQRMEAISGSLQVLDGGEGSGGDAFLAENFDSSDVSQAEASRKAGVPETISDSGQRNNRAKRAESEMPASVAAMDKFLNPETGQTDIDWKAVKENFDDADLTAWALDQYGDFGLVPLLIAARDGDTEAQAAFYERTTIDTESDLIAAAGLTEAEFAVLGGTDSSQLPGDYYQTERRTGDEVRTAFLDEAQEYFESIQLPDQTIDRDDGRAASFQDRLFRLQEAEGWTNAERDAYAYDVLQKASANEGVDLTTVDPARLAMFGESVVEYVRDVAIYKAKINKGANGFALVEEVVEGWFKRYLKTGEASMEDFIAWKHQVEAERGGRREYDDSARGVTEWTSRQGVAWFAANRRNLEKSGAMPQSFREFLQMFFEKVKSIFKDAAFLRKLKRDGKLDPKFMEFLDRATGQDEAFLVEQFERGETAESFFNADQELLPSIRGLGGIPTPDAAPEFRGELELLRESFGTRWASMANSKGTMDGLREGLQEAGFRFETPADLLDALDAASRGEKVFPMLDSRSAAAQREASFSIGLLPEVEARIEKAAATKPLELEAGASKSDITKDLFESTLATLSAGVRNSDTGRIVASDRKKLKHVESNVNAPVRVAAFKQVERVLKEAIWLTGAKPDSRIRKKKFSEGSRFHYLALPVEYEKKPFLVMLVVQKDDKGRNLYNIQDFDIKETSDSLVGIKSTATGGKNPMDSISKVIRDFVERKSDVNVRIHPV